MTELESLESERYAADTGGVSYISGEFLYGPAEVTTRFDRVANLENQRGWCVSVGTIDLSPGPNTILFGRDEFERIGLEPGQTAKIATRSLNTARGAFFYEHRQMSQLRLARPTKYGIGILRDALRDYGVGACQYVLSNVDDIPFPEARVGELAEALPERSAATRVLGLGNGYTPSGDDVLLGFIAAYTVYLGSFPESLVGVWDTARRTSTSLAATTMKFASEGVVSSRLREVLMHLSGSDEDLTEVVRRFVQEVGHSSGSDILLGVFLALRKILRRGDI